MIKLYCKSDYSCRELVFKAGWINVDPDVAAFLKRDAKNNFLDEKAGVAYEKELAAQAKVDAKAIKAAKDKAIKGAQNK